MKSKFLFLSFFLLTLIGCKDEKSIDSLKIVKPETTDTFFKVTLNVIVKKDDDFALFYTQDGTTDFKTAPIWQAVKGNEGSQQVQYNLPPNVLPTQLRMDFGLKPNQEDIVLKSVILEYKDKKREIEGTELGNFFRADVNKCTFDASTGLIKSVIKDGVRQSPSIYPHEMYLGPELKKLEK